MKHYWTHLEQLIWTLWRLCSFFFWTKKTTIIWKVSNMTSIEENQKGTLAWKEAKWQGPYIKERFWTLLNVELSFIALENVTICFNRNLKLASLVENITIGCKIVLKENMLIQRGRHAKLLAWLKVPSLMMKVWWGWIDKRRSSFEQWVWSI